MRCVASSGTLNLGRQGENLAREFEFDFSMWKEQYGEGTISLIAQRCTDDTPYPVAITIEGNKAIWTVTNADTAFVGTGKCELRYTVDEVIVKSATYRTKVAPSLSGELQPAPEPQIDWVEKVLEAKDEAVDAAKKAQEFAETDKTLSIPDKPADSKVVGETFVEVGRWMEEVQEKIDKPRDTIENHFRVVNGEDKIRITASDEIPEDAFVYEDNMSADGDARIRVKDGELYIESPDGIDAISVGDYDGVSWYEPYIGTKLKLTRYGVYVSINDSSFYGLASADNVDKKLNLSGGTMTGDIYYKSTANKFLRTDNIVSWAIANMDTWTPFFSSFHIARVQKKSYTGTGVYGEENARTLTFDFQPKVVIIKKKMSVPLNDDGSEKVSGINEALMVAFYGEASSISSVLHKDPSYTYCTHLSWSGKSMTLWGVSDTRHLNNSGQTYNVLAIG